MKRKQSKSKKTIIASTLIASILLSTGFIVSISQIKNDVSSVILNTENLQNQNDENINNSRLIINQNNYNNIKKNSSFTNTNWESMNDKITFIPSSDNNKGQTESEAYHFVGVHGLEKIEIDKIKETLFKFSYFNVNDKYNTFFKKKYDLSMNFQIQIYALSGKNSTSNGTIDTLENKTNLKKYNSSSYKATSLWDNISLNKNNAYLELKNESYIHNKGINVEYHYYLHATSFSLGVTDVSLIMTDYLINLSLEILNLTKMYSYMIDNYLKNNQLNFPKEYILQKSNDEKLYLLNQTIKNYLTSNFDTDTNNNPSNPYDKIYQPSDFKTSVDLKKVTINNQEQYVPTFNFTFRDFLDKEVNGSYQPNYVTISYPIQTNLWLDYNNESSLRNQSDIWFGNYTYNNPYLLTGDLIKYTSDKFIDLIRNIDLKKELFYDVLNLNNHQNKTSLPINTNLSQSDFNELTFLNKNLQLDPYQSKGINIDVIHRQNFNTDGLLASGKLNLSFILGSGFSDAYLPEDENIYLKNDNYNNSNYEYYYNNPQKGVINQMLDGFVRQYDVYYRSNINSGAEFVKNGEFDSSKADQVVEAKSLTLFSTDSLDKNYETINVDKRKESNNGVNDDYLIDGKWIFDHLITFENERFNTSLFNDQNQINNNHYKILDSRNIQSRNSILATNLDPQDFAKRVLLGYSNPNVTINLNDVNIINQINEQIKVIYRDKTLGKILVKISFKGDLGDDWLSNKPETLNDQINDSLLFKQVKHTQEDNSFYFWVDGFKKNYDFTMKKARELDANKLIINPDENHNDYYNSLAQFTTNDLYQMIENNNSNNIGINESTFLKSLISFNDIYNHIDNDEYIDNKLIRTRLSFNEFMHLINYKLNALKQDEFNGIYEGEIILNNEATYHNYQEGDQLFEKINKTENQIHFKIKNLKKRVLLFDKPLENNEFLTVPGTSDITVNEFIGDFDNGNKDTFYDNFTSKLFSYNKVYSQNEKPQKFDNILLTNAKSQEEILTSIKNGMLTNFNLIANNPMGELQIDFDLVLTNGKINDEIVSSSNQPAIKHYSIKLGGFKKAIELQNSTISLDINKINSYFKTNFTNPNQISTDFILNNLIWYSDSDNYKTNPDIPYLFKVNVTKQEFRNTLLVDNNPISYEISNDKSSLLGTFKFKQIENNSSFEIVDNNQNLLPTMGSNVSFRIVNFTKQIELNWNNYKIINIKDLLEENQKITINQINQDFILNNLIKYDVVDKNEFNKQALLNTNVDYNCFVNEILEKIEINKYESTGKVVIKFILKNENDLTNAHYVNLVDNVYTFTINGFDAKQQFIINNTVNYNNQSDFKTINIRTVDEQLILDKFISYENINKSTQAILSTSISKSDFINNYFDHIQISKKSINDNSVEGVIYFKQLINNVISFSFKINFSQKLIGIDNVNNQFILNQSDKLASIYAANLDLNQLLKLISFNNSQTNALFNINCNQQEFVEMLNPNNPFSLEPNDKLGIIKLKLNFIDNQVNLVINNEQLNLINSLDLTIGGFKNNINFRLNDKSININDYAVLKDFKGHINQIDKQFVIDNLIKFTDNTNINNIIGEFNISKAEFMQILDDINLQIIDNDTLNISINLKTNLNSFNNQRGLNNNINVQLVNFKKTNPVKDNSAMIIALSVSIPVGLILIISAILISYFVIKKKKFKSQIKNEI